MKNDFLIKLYPKKRTKKDNPIFENIPISRVADGVENHPRQRFFFLRQEFRFSRLTSDWFPHVSAEEILIDQPPTD